MLLGELELADMLLELELDELLDELDSLDAELGLEDELELELSLELELELDKSSILKISNLSPRLALGGPGNCR